MASMRTDLLGSGSGQHALSRRRLLRIGSLGILGSCWFGFPRPASAKPSGSRASGVILLHQFGGPSHLDTLDMKPRNPEEFRGEFRPCPTRVPGISVCERLPRLGQVADKFTLVRSLSHTMKFHNSAGYYSLTGHAPPVDDLGLRDTPELFPAYGSVVDRLAPGPEGVPSFVALPWVPGDGDVTPGQHASFLGRAHDPLRITQDPNAANFAVPELSLPANLSVERLENRRSIRRLLDRQTEAFEASAATGGIGKFFDKGFAMLTRPQVRQAFDLSAEPAPMRERYGHTTYGQSCLLARRLIEAGVRFVNVYFSKNIGGDTGGWDTHGFNNHPMGPILKKHLLPVTDQTVPTLLEDLDARGLLDQTLVVWVGEFGRTPRINKHGGRDHWPKCYTALLAGGGIKRGHVHGASDRYGAYPDRDPVTPEDLAATLFTLLGVDPQTEITDLLGRPFPIAAGKPVYGLIA